MSTSRQSDGRPSILKGSAAFAESILQNGQETPIMVREDGGRFVLVEGLHRLEACRSLGEDTIRGYLVQARRH
jgi:sulfiredoxin